MPNYRISSRAQRGNDEWTEWYYQFYINAPSEKQAIQEARGSFNMENLELKAELSPHQRKQTKYPPLASLEPKKLCDWVSRIRRTNEPGTCLWCGKKLLRTGVAGLGSYRDNAFCTLRCGYEFGITAAVLGYRLKPRDDANG